MKYREITEGTMIPSVFHGTFKRHAVAILESNEIQPNTKHEAKRLLKDYSGDRLVKGISTSRSLPFALYYATGAVFELDLRKLKQTMQVIPIDFYGERVGGQIRKTTRSESEEFVVTIKPIRLDQYLIAIHVVENRYETMVSDSQYDIITQHPLLKIVKS
jgi:hypothetical protein